MDAIIFSVLALVIALGGLWYHDVRHPPEEQAIETQRKQHAHIVHCLREPLLDKQDANQRPESGPLMRVHLPLVLPLLQGSLAVFFGLVHLSIAPCEPGMMGEQQARQLHFGMGTERYLFAIGTSRSCSFD